MDNKELNAAVNQLVELMDESFGLPGYKDYISLYNPYFHNILFSLVHNSFLSKFHYFLTVLSFSPSFHKIYIHS